MSGVRFDVLQGFAIPERDLGSVELWDRSLNRSRQRRHLAVVGRRSRRRRKSVSLAMTAALVTAPVFPELTAAETSPSSASSAGAVNKDALTAAGQRTVLQQGSQGPLVAAAQRRLNEVLPVTHIAEDGIFGPQTRGAVAEFQRRENLSASGTIDTRTWAMMFKAPVLVFGGMSAAGANSTGSGTSSTGSAPSSGVSASESGSKPRNAGSAHPAASGPVRSGRKAAQTAVFNRGRQPATGIGGGALEKTTSAGGQPDTSVPPSPAGSTNGDASSGVGTSSPPAPHRGSPSGNSGTPPVAVVAPTSPPKQTSTYVLTNGVALPLPRQYLANGSVDQGVDYAAPGGTPEYAMGDGVIIGQGISGFGPNAPILKITSGPLSGAEIYYGHAGPNLVHVGDHVHAGQQITIVGYGIVGISTGPHIEVGFYPPGGMGAGSRMLSVINSMMSQHPSGRAWGTGGQVLANTSRRSSRVVHSSRKRVVHRSRRHWGSGGVAVVTSTGATVSTTPASGAVASTAGPVVTSTAPPVMTVTPPPVDTSAPAPTPSAAPAVESTSPAVAESPSAGETTAPEAPAPTSPAAGTVQAAPTVDGAQTAPTAASAPTPAPVDGTSASAGTSPGGDNGVNGGGSSSQTPAGSQGNATTTNAGAPPQTTSAPAAPVSQAPQQASSAPSQQDAGAKPANADPAPAATGPASSADSAGAAGNGATSTPTATSQTGAAAPNPSAASPESGKAQPSAGSAG